MYRSSIGVTPLESTPTLGEYPHPPLADGEGAVRMTAMAACLCYLAGMDRAGFLRGMGLLAGGMLPGVPVWATGSGRRGLLPPPLRAGDVIGLTSPAGYISVEDVQPAVAVILTWGFGVRYGDTLGRRDGSLGGSDAERAADLQRMMEDPAVRAILCARGGYGVTRILDTLDLRPLRRDPKWIIGFSDVTALHLHLWQNLRIASIHSKMCNSFPSDWMTAEPIVRDTILSIRAALTGEPVEIYCPPHPSDRNGVCTGPLVGGNLSVIHTCMGTRSELDTRDCILFLEDVGEYPYSIDRMLTNLQRAGKFDRLRGLVLGGFSGMKRESAGEEFGRSLERMVTEKLGAGSFPVCFGFPVGHQRDNYALVHGRRYRLEVSDDGSSLGVID
jgi:muramoyltetrapeptide carboxypeptidase